MSMVFAGFMGAAARDRELKEEREATNKLFDKKVAADRLTQSMTLIDAQKLKDKTLGTEVDQLMTKYNLDERNRQEVLNYVTAEGMAKTNEYLYNGDLTFNPYPSSGTPARGIGGNTVNWGEGEQYKGMLAGISTANGLPKDYLHTVAAVESGFNPRPNAMGSPADGWFQIMPATARQYGINDVYDMQESAEGMGKFSSDNLNTLRTTLGREPTGAELYLAHQQGGGGASQLLTNPNGRAVDVLGSREKVRQNLPADQQGRVDTITAGEFSEIWTGKYDSLASLNDTAVDDQTDSILSDVTVSTSGSPAEEQTDEALAVPGAVFTPKAGRDTAVTDEQYTATWKDDDGNLNDAMMIRTNNPEEFRIVGQEGVVRRDQIVGTMISESLRSDVFSALSQIGGEAMTNLGVQRTQLKSGLSNAYILDQMVLNNESILTTVGGTGSKLVDRLSTEFQTVLNLVNNGASIAEVEAKFGIDKEGLAGQANDSYLFEAQVLRFAYNYAAAGLGQSGQGLSNKDFETAMNIVSAGTNYQTFSTNLRELTRDMITKVSNATDTEASNPKIKAFAIAYRGTDFKTVLDDAISPVEGWLRTENRSGGQSLGMEYDWAMDTDVKSTTPPTDPPAEAGDVAADIVEADIVPVPSPDVSMTPIGDPVPRTVADLTAEETLYTDAAADALAAGEPVVVTEALMLKYPSLQGMLGKTVQKKRSE